MNYLAHAYLSGSRQEILVGNMIGDFIKGKYFDSYPAGVQQGIQFHRHIDSFTDSNLHIIDAKRILRNDSIKNSGVFVDLLFDHFLATDENIFSSEKKLLAFTENVYAQLWEYDHILSDEMKTYFTSMTKHNWLFHYRFREGIERAVMGFLKKHPILGQAEEVIFALYNNYNELKEKFDLFMPEITEWSKSELAKLA